MKNKKVVFVVNTLKAGGSERVFWLMSNYFAQQHDTWLIVMNNREPFFKDANPNLKIVNLQAVQASKGIFKLAKQLRNIQPDVVFVTGTHLNIIIGLISFFVKIKKIIARESSITNEMQAHLTQFKFKAKIVLGSIKHLYPRFQYIICQTINMQQSMLQHYKIDSSKLKVIANPVSHTSIINSKQKTDIIQLVTIGRMTPEKGHERLIKSMAKLDQNFHLDIYGDGILKKNLQKLIDELQLNDRVRLCGLCNDVLNTLAQYDCFLLSSFTEGFPNVLLESLSVGTPAVAYQVSGVDVMINTENGFIIQQQKEDDFFNAIRKAANTVWDKEKIKSNCIKKYAIENIAKQYEDLIT